LQFPGFSTASLVAGVGFAWNDVPRAALASADAPALDHRGGRRACCRARGRASRRRRPRPSGRDDRRSFRPQVGSAAALPAAAFIGRVGSPGQGGVERQRPAVAAGRRSGSWARARARGQALAHERDVVTRYVWARRGGCRRAAGCRGFAGDSHSTVATNLRPGPGIARRAPLPALASSRLVRSFGRIRRSRVLDEAVHLDAAVS
jgi:hypothetical protein